MYESQHGIIRNVLVQKAKNSDFLEYFRSKNLSNSSIIRIIPSGNYYIYTLDIFSKDLIPIIEEIQDKWI